MDIDDEVIRQRLLTRTTMVGKSMMKRTADCLFSFLDSTGQLDRYNDDFLETPPPKKSKPSALGKKRAQEEMDNFLWELEMLQVEAQRTKLLVFTCERELEAYAALHDDIDKSIVAVTKEIDQLKGVVANEKIIRSYKEAYEAAARVVNDYASPQQSAEVLEGLEDQLRSSKEALQAITDRIDLKSKELALLVRAIRDLQSDRRELPDDAAADDAVERDDTEHDGEYESKHTDEKREDKQSAPEASPPDDPNDDDAPTESPPPASSHSHRHRHKSS